MARKENQDKQDLVSLLRDEKGLLNEILNLLKTQESTRTDLTKSQTEANRIQREFNSLIETANKATEDRVSDLNATAKIQKAITREANLQKQIQQKIDSSTGAEKEAYKDLKDSTKKVTENLKGQLKNAQELDKYGGFFVNLSEAVKKVPLLSVLEKPFKGAAESARKTADEQIKQGKSVSRLKTSFASMKTLVGPGSGLLGILTVLVKLFTAADARATNLAKSLGISKANARGIVNEFSKIQSSNLLVNLNNLAESVGQLTEGLGATAIQSKSTLENQIFLNKNLGLSAEQASKLSILGDSFNISSRKATDNVIEMSDELSKTNGFLIPVKNLLGEIANLSAEIQGYFGFSTKELQAAVYQTRRFGISLNTANSIAGSLLDFETSIRNELQLELLTNRSLNFERARSLAFTGDIAGASAEVLKQTQMLTEAQRRNPIILKAAADAAGISVDELNKAFIIQKRLNIRADEYNSLLQKGSDLVGFERASVLMMQSGSREQFEQTLSVQEKLNAAITRVTDQFQTLVDNGAIDAFIDGIAAFVGALGSGRGIFGAMSAFTSASKETKIKFQQGNSSEQLDDFTIRANPKDTLVMAGGTKFGEETNALLRELITAVNAGGDVYMSGTKVGKHIFGNLTKQS